METTNPEEGAFGGRSLVRFAPLLVLTVILVTACATGGPSAKNDWKGLSPEQAVQKRINLDSRLEDTHVSAGFEGGTATLNGEVQSLGEKLVAEEDLYEVKGVRRVTNNLKVESSNIPDDEIARSILGAIPMHCLLGTEDIKVNVKDGHVTLTGRSKQLHHKDVIMNIAIFTRGVRSVDNEIQVVPDVSQGKSTDRGIRENVEGVLASLPVDTNSIHIKVEHGEVKLTGSVDSHVDSKQILEAVRNVPGVLDVKNEMTSYKGYYDAPFIYYY